jgi:hypothetical protein
MVPKLLIFYGHFAIPAAVILWSKKPNKKRNKQAPDLWFSNPSGRVARWFVFQPKIPILVKFGGFCNGKYWYIL